MVDSSGSPHCRLSALSMVNCLGSDLEAIGAKLFGGEGRDLQRHEFGESVTALVGRVSEPFGSLPEPIESYRSRLAYILNIAVQRLESDIARVIERYGAERVGIVCGSSTSGIDASEDAFNERTSRGEFPEDFHYRRQELGAVSVIVQQLTGARGPAFTVSTACSSSAKAFGAARRLLRVGLCDAVIVGGADALCALTVQGFRSLELVDETQSNPMSANRRGLNLGEGACLMILERGPGGVQLLGVGEASDAYHISTPHPEGRGAVAAMRGALRDSGRSPEQIRYINLHGTGTVHNDAMESAAVAEVFGDRVLCSSTKPFVGHLLGAAGATEVGFCWMLLHQVGGRKTLPPQLWDAQRDPRIPKIAIAATGDTLDFQPGDAVLSNSFAFGGSNCAVIIGLEES
jgi:3-oxoacyl-[acyl-carrier-protein] synthase-1